MLSWQDPWKDILARSLYKVLGLTLIVGSAGPLFRPGRLPCHRRVSLKASALSEDQLEECIRCCFSNIFWWIFEFFLFAFFGGNRKGLFQIARRQGQSGFYMSISFTYKVWTTNGLFDAVAIWRQMAWSFFVSYAYMLLTVSTSSCVGHVPRLVRFAVATANIYIFISMMRNIKFKWYIYIHTYMWHTCKYLSYSVTLMSGNQLSEYRRHGGILDSSFLYSAFFVSWKG